MKDDLRYAPSDCFETFPFPPGYETDAALEEAGRRYHDYRAELMVAANEGMTKTYNRFHEAPSAPRPSPACASSTTRWTAPSCRLRLARPRRARRAPASSPRPTRTTTPTRTACSGPPPPATKSSPASSPSTPTRPAEEVAAGLVSANGKKTRRKVEDEEAGTISSRMMETNEAWQVLRPRP